MTKFRLLAGCGLMAALVGAAQAPAVAAPQAQAMQVPASDLRPDPAVRYGVLPNGMHYQIMRNATPPHNASLRLRIAAGSLYERDDQRGIAHFIEHMVFNGTTHVPKGEFVRRLERAGLKFGPDTNAATSFDETVYMLDLPETDANTVDTALLLLREGAGEALFEPQAIDAERGVVLSEERTRATPAYRNAIDELHYLFKGDIVADRMPIGLTDVLRTAPRERFVDFYNAYYRPERATLIAVGDFDVDAMEARIRKQFGNWAGKSVSGPEVPLAKVAARALEARLFVEPGVANKVSISWVSPPDLRPDSRPLRREKLVRGLALRILNRRFSRLASGDRPPFVGASAAHEELAERGRLTQISAVAQPGKWQEALNAIDLEQRRAATQGFSQAELDRELSEIRAAATAASAGATTRQTAGLAQGLVGALNEKEVFTSPADDLALFEEISRSLNLAEVNAAARELFAGGGPLLYLTSPTPTAEGEAGLRAAYEGAHRAALGASAGQETKAWPYNSFGTPGAVAERRELPGLGATAIRFRNGVRLTVKPTAFGKDEILISTRIGNGLLDLPRDRAKQAWAFSLGAFTMGGLGKIGYEDLQQTLASKVYGAGFGVGENAFVLQGRTRPADLGVQLQVLAAYASDPGFRPTGWNRFRSLAGTIHDQLATTPGGVLSRDLGALLHSGDPRWATPSREEMAASSIEAARPLVAGSLSSEPIEIIMVGDVTVDEAVRQVAATFGALPARREGPVSRDALRIAFPAPGLVRETHKGRADQGLAFIAWPTVDFYSDTKRARTLNLLAQVLRLRLLDEIRIKQGTTYSPVAGHSPSEIFPGYGYMVAQIEAPPEKLDGFLADAAKIAADLRDRPVTEDELQRAKKPTVEGLIRQQASNAWWLGELDQVQTRAEVGRSIASLLGEYQAVNAADLQRAARQYLVDAKAWKLEIVPGPKG